MVKNKIINWLKQKDHPYELRTGDLAKHALYFFISLIGFLIVYKNIAVLNGINLSFFYIGSIILWIITIFLLKYGYAILKNFRYATLGSPNFVKVSLGIVFLIFLLVIYYNPQTISKFTGFFNQKFHLEYFFLLNLSVFGISSFFSIFIGLAVGYYFRHVIMGEKKNYYSGHHHFEFPRIPFKGIIAAILIVFGFYVVFINTGIGLAADACSSPEGIIMLGIGSALQGNAPTAETLQQTCDTVRLIYYGGWAALLIGAYLLFFNR